MLAAKALETRSFRPGHPATRLNSQTGWRRRDWLLLVFLALLSTLAFLPWLGSFGIIDPSEGYYAEAAREMTESGNYLTPFLNYQPYFEKPILTYWLIAASYKTFGLTEFAARLPAALCGIFFVLSTYALSRQFLRVRAALFTALVLLSTPLFLLVGHLSLTDMPFALSVAVALLSFWSVLRTGSPQPAPAVLLPLAYSAVGLAVLCKGPLGLVLVGAVIVAYQLKNGCSRFEWLNLIRAVRPLSGALIVALITLPWYVAESVATNGAFAREFFLSQNLGRAVGTQGIHHNIQWWFYAPYFFGGCLPWSLLLAGAVPFVRRSFRVGKPTNARSKTVRFASIWLLVMLVLFSLVPTKLSTYILPVVPALAVLIGMHLDTVLRLTSVRPFVWTAPLMVSASLAAVFFIPALVKKAPELAAPAMAMAAAFALGYLLYAYHLWRKQTKAAVYQLLATQAVGLMLLVPLALNVYYAYHQKSFHNLVLTQASDKAELGILGPTAGSAPFYLHRKITRIKSRDDLEQFLKGSTPQHLLVMKNDLHDLYSWTDRSMTTIAQSGKWYLLAVENKTGPASTMSAQDLKERPVLLRRSGNRACTFGGGNLELQ